MYWVEVTEMPPPDVCDFIAAKLLEHMTDGVLDDQDPGHVAFLSEPTHIPLDKVIRAAAKLTKTPAEVVLAAYGLFLRTVTLNPDLPVIEANVRRLIYVCMMLASKMYIDIPFNNRSWARWSGFIPNEQINTMEIDLLKLLQFNVHISAAQLEGLKIYYHRWVSGSGGGRRNTD